MSRLFKNVTYNVLGQGVVLALGFVGVKFIFSHLGADAFGIIYFTAVMTGVLTAALELGVLSTTIRQVSSHFATDRAYVERLARTASLFYWGVGIILFVAIFVAAPFLADQWINLTTIDHATATTMLRFLSITTLITLPRALYSSLFQGRQRMELNNAIDVSSSAIQQLGVIVILARGGNAFAAVQWLAFAAVLSTLAYMIVVARLFGPKALIPAYFPEVVRRNIGFTAHMGALSVLNMILLQFDKVVVSKLLPIASVGYYAFASTVVVRLSFAAGAIAQAALPSFSEFHARNETNPLLLQYRKLQDLISFGMVLPFTAVIFAAIPIYSYLFNRQVAHLLLLPTAVLCLGFFMGATVNIPYTFSIAIGRPQIASRTNLLALFVVVPVTTLLIYWYGLIGAASSWVVYNLFVYAYMIPRICRECLFVSPIGWYAHVAKVLVLAGATYGLAWLFIPIPHSYSTQSLVVAYGLASATFLAGALLFMGPELRQTIWRLPRRLATREAGPVL